VDFLHRVDCSRFCDDGTTGAVGRAGAGVGVADGFTAFGFFACRLAG